MERLFSPWRSKYIASFKDETPGANECLFCRIAKDRNDGKHLVVARRKHCYVVMNLYPYNSGHVMVVPYKHTAWFGDLTNAEYGNVMRTTATMMDVLSEVLTPHGFNFGSNIGRVAGAGIDQHIHFHIVPRWNGDTNFMPVIADTKLVSEHIREVYKKLKKASPTKPARLRVRTGRSGG
ncbi:MAG: HIT domain-containing protein [Ignavibacteriales bacterium]|nr:HIT domain-containing protein [Ignavibacteriales bacterium]